MKRSELLDLVAKSLLNPLSKEELINIFIVAFSDCGKAEAKLFMINKVLKKECSNEEKLQLIIEILNKKLED